MALMEYNKPRRQGKEYLPAAEAYDTCQKLDLFGIIGEGKNNLPGKGESRFGALNDISNVEKTFACAYF